MGPRGPWASPCIPQRLRVKFSRPRDALTCGNSILISCADKLLHIRSDVCTALPSGMGACTKLRLPLKLGMIGKHLES